METYVRETKAYLETSKGRVIRANANLYGLLIRRIGSISLEQYPEGYHAVTSKYRNFKNLKGEKLLKILGDGINSFKDVPDDEIIKTIYVNI